MTAPRREQGALVASLGLVALFLFVSGSSASPRVIVFSWDGAGYEMTSRLIADGHLPNLARMQREGAWSDGMVSSFPTKTAAAHAVLFTGQFGHTNGITGNYLWRHPASEHDRLATESGYGASALRVDPLWVMSTRAGLTTFTLHASHVYPFEFALERLEPSAASRLHMLHGYTGARVHGAAFNEDAAPARAPAGWSIPEAGGAEAREIRFDVGDSEFWGLFFDDPLDPTVGCDTLGIVRHRGEAEFQARVKAGPGASFSVPVRAAVGGADVWFSLRLFELDADADRYLIYRSGASELAVSNEHTPGRGEPVLQVYAGDGGTRAYGTGALGSTLVKGGDGAAERRFVETLAHVQGQLMRQFRLVLSEPYDLVILYSSLSDNAAHELTGFLEPSLASFDAARAERTWETLAASFSLQDELLGEVLEHAARDEAHVVLVSDHGMAATDRLLHLNIALAQAGLVVLRPDGSVDLSASKVLVPPLDDTSVAVNTTDRASGIVPLGERDAVLAELRRVLGAIKDPDTGESVITAMYEAAEEGLLQPGGSSTGDLFLDFLPGYYPSASTTAEVLIEPVAPRGTHMFVPTRRDMLAILAAWGPRVPAGARFGKVRAIDVTPTVIDLLEITPPALPGRSLLKSRTLLDTP